MVIHTTHKGFCFFTLERSKQSQNKSDSETDSNHVTINDF